MKQIRRSTAKTRKGIITWLAKMNPFFTTTQQKHVYENEYVVAIHVNRYTGAMVAYELANGDILPIKFDLCIAA